jgi:hypothetical protein
MTLRRLVYVVVLVSLVWTSRVWLPARQIEPVMALFRHALATSAHAPGAQSRCRCTGRRNRSTSAVQRRRLKTPAAREAALRQPTDLLMRRSRVRSQHQTSRAVKGCRDGSSVGDCIYKSTDAGQTTHFRAARAQRLKIVVDPTEPVFVAARHPRPNEERGIFDL